MRRILLGTSVVLLLAAAPAAALPPQFELAALFANPQAQATERSTDIPVRLTGGIIVSFAGSPAAGCAARGLCAYHGTLLYNAAGSGDVGIESYIVDGRRQTDDVLEPSVAINGVTGVYTWTDVRRVLSDGAQSECVDDQPGGVVDARPQGGEVSFALGDLISPTRCAAPLSSDLDTALPRFALSAAELAHGRRTIDLSGVRTFAGGGFAGTVTSTLTVTLGKPQHRSAIIVGSHPERYRIVSQTLSVAAAIGAITYHLQGSTDQAVCVLLDSCGVVGTLTVSAQPLHATGVLTASGPAKRPLRDFLTALGLARGGRTSGISVVGVIIWSRGGTVHERLDQSGTCRDVAGLDGGLLVLEAGRRQLAGFIATAAPRTRCPGPVVQSANGLAAATAARSALARPVLTLEFKAGPAVNDDGYTVTDSGGLTLTLRRGRPSTTITSVPVLF